VRIEDIVRQEEEAEKRRRSRIDSLDKDLEKILVRIELGIMENVMKVRMRVLLANDKLLWTPRGAGNASTTSRT